MMWDFPEKDWDSGAKYVTKLKSRIDGPWTFNCDVPPRNKKTYTYSFEQYEHLTKNELKKLPPTTICAIRNAKMFLDDMDEDSWGSEPDIE